MFLLRVRVVTYATTYNLTPPHDTQLTPQPLTQYHKICWAGEAGFTPISHRPAAPWRAHPPTLQGLCCRGHWPGAVPQNTRLQEIILGAVPLVNGCSMLFTTVLEPHPTCRRLESHKLPMNITLAPPTFWHCHWRIPQVRPIDSGKFC